MDLDVSVYMGSHSGNFIPTFLGGCMTIERAIVIGILAVILVFLVVTLL